MHVFPRSNRGPLSRITRILVATTNQGRVRDGDDNGQAHMTPTAMDVVVIPARRHRLFRLFTLLVIIALMLFVATTMVVVPSRQDKVVIASPQRDPRLRELGMVAYALAESSSSSIADATLLNRRIHFMYNIGCDGEFWEWQALQALVLDRSWARVGQTGRLTRLVTGCDAYPTRKAVMMYGLLPEVEIHFVPGGTDQFDVPSLDGNNNKQTQHATYVQMNRPIALQHFLTSSLYSNRNNSEIIIVIDPDFVFRKPLGPVEFMHVQPGICMASTYSLSMSDFKTWGHHVLTHHQLCSSSTNEARCKDKIASYKTTISIGVPYVMLLEDWLRVLPTWIKLIPSGFHYYNGIESDMYTFSLALIALDMKIIPRNDFMATCMMNDNSVHTLRIQYFLHLCQSYEVPETREGISFQVNPAKEVISASRLTRNQARWPLQNITHYFVFNKHWLKGYHFWACTSPLIVPPPDEQLDIRDDEQTAWHRFVALEAVWAYNAALRAAKEENKAKCRAEELAIGEEGLLIMHERHSNRFDGKLNHVIKV